MSTDLAIPMDLVETIYVRDHAAGTMPVAGATIAPGLAITQALNKDGTISVDRFAVTHVPSARRISRPLCADHVRQAAYEAATSGIRWPEHADEIRDNQHARRIGEAILTSLRCDTGECGGEVNLYAFCAAQADAFRTFENREMAMYPTDEDRDTHLMQWVLRVLAHPENKGTADVLEQIDRARAAAVTA